MGMQEGTGNDDGELGAFHSVITPKVAAALEKKMLVSEFIRTQGERSKAKLLQTKTETMENPHRHVDPSRLGEKTELDIEFQYYGVVKEVSKAV